MTTLRKVLPLIHLTVVALCIWTLTSHHSPIGPRTVYAQNSPDCSFTHQFTGDSTSWTGVSNLSGNTPCVNWRVTFSATATLTTQVTFQTSPDGSTWTSVPNTICSAGVQPPCIIQGTNPTASGAQGMLYVSLYGNYVRVITSGSAGTGTATVRGYGAKGATASAGAGIGGNSGNLWALSGNTLSPSIATNNIQVGTRVLLSPTTGLDVSSYLGTVLMSSLTGPLKMTAGVPSVEASSDVIGLWSGTCNSGSILGGDGICKVVSTAIPNVTVAGCVPYETSPGVLGCDPTYNTYDIAHNSLNPVVLNYNTGHDLYVYGGNNNSPLTMTNSGGQGKAIVDRIQVVHLIQSNPVLVSALSPCAYGTLNWRDTVSDATLATPGSTAVGGGTFTIAVQCIFNSAGSVYTWIID